MSMNHSVLSLVDKGLKLDSKKDIKPYIDGLELEKISVVDMSGNTIGTEAAQELGSALGNMTSLKVARLSNIFTGRGKEEIPFSLTAICDGLLHARDIEQLNLSNNAFGSRFVYPLVPLFMECQQIRVLKLRNLGLGEAGGKQVADALLESAKMSKASGRHSNLRTVICSKNRLEGSAPHWATAFAEHGDLAKVRMFNCGIKESGFVAIVNALSTCPNLRFLDLSDNVGRNYGTDPDDEHGWAALALALGKWKNLETLKISDCNMEPSDLVRLLNQMESGCLPHLKTLELRNSEVGEDSLDQLLRVTSSRLPSLTTLDLAENDLDNDYPILSGISAVLQRRGGSLVLEEKEEDDDEKDDDDDYLEEVDANEKTDVAEEFDDLSAHMQRLDIHST